MPSMYKVLGQVAPNANTVSNVYTVPAATQAVVSTIIVTNRNNNANATYRIAVQPAGAVLANQHYIAYDVTVAANDTTSLTLGLTLAAGNSIQVYASAATSLTFQAFGSEITA